MTRFGLEAQLKIYAQGLLPDGTKRMWPIALEAWREQARERLAVGPWGYLEGGAGGGSTMAANREAFSKWALRPRMMRNVEDRDLSIDLLGTTYPAPFLLAPIGVQSILHREAELAPARAAAERCIPFLVSTVSSVPMETIAQAMGDAPRWFQLYPGRDPNIVSSFIQRAERSGYSALVVTVDTTMLGWREMDLDNAYLPFLFGEGVANFFTDPVFRSRLSESPEANPQAAIQEFLSVYVNPAFTLEDLADIRRQTKLPLWVKGITHPEDALAVQALGADGVIVSNHGGRQVDGAVASLDALPEIRSAVGDAYPLLFDSGVRRAADILKALALGADAVLVGRPYAYALAVGGQAGVTEWLHLLLAELDLELALAGYRSIRDVDRSAVTRVSR
ncbi:oxidoreductase [Alicyclobacillus contaminans]|uniref:alpha-hydroxy-acid oxidizing protein n=1 Tax=Alicyclobacillus contaminans TaxID=392016 RepID=UPI00047BEC0E|nr:alpha-hydroxy-acid oxidizing protein [Alicyclobacillus contaminans]GMA51510.1 oxidoreductase [Alicyclobacillus contaminans]